MLGWIQNLSQAESLDHLFTSFFLMRMKSRLLHNKSGCVRGWLIKRCRPWMTSTDMVAANGKTAHGTECVLETIVPLNQSQSKYWMDPSSPGPEIRCFLWTSTCCQLPTPSRNKHTTTLCCTRSTISLTLMPSYNEPRFFHLRYLLARWMQDLCCVHTHDEYQKLETTNSSLDLQGS